MLRAVFFDFDGTIVNTEPIHYKAYQEILTPFGLEYSWDDYILHYMGLDDREVFRRVCGNHSRNMDDNELERMIRRKADIFHDLAGNGIQPFPGVAELIAALSGTLPLAICSGALHSDVGPILEKIGLYDAFDIIVTADDVAVSKPDPASYTLAVQRLASAFPGEEIVPRYCIAIEDTPAGIASAKGAGIAALAVTNSYPAAKLADAMHIVDSLESVNLKELGKMLLQQQI
jgi:beta-phosphoglucomutase